MNAITDASMPGTPTPATPTQGEHSRGRLCHTPPDPSPAGARHTAEGGCATHPTRATAPPGARHTAGGPSTPRRAGSNPVPRNPQRPPLASRQGRREFSVRRGRPVRDAMNLAQHFRDRDTAAKAASPVGTTEIPYPCWLIRAHPRSSAVGSCRPLAALRHSFQAHIRHLS